MYKLVVLFFTALLTVASSQTTCSDGPVFHFHTPTPTGLMVTLPGPHEPNNIEVSLKFDVNVDQELNEYSRGQYNGETVIPPGLEWRFAIPNIKVHAGSIIYYHVTVQGRQGRRQWTREYKGHYQVPKKYDSNLESVYNNYPLPEPVISAAPRPVHSSTEQSNHVKG